MPTINHISVSRRIEDENEKERLKQLVKEIGNDGEGYIVRTAAQDAQRMDFDADIKFFHRLWKNLKKKSIIRNNSAISVKYCRMQRLIVYYTHFLLISQLHLLV